MAVGAALAAPAAWLEFGSRSGAWWIDGLGLLLGATGAALMWAGLTGPRPDWVDRTITAEPAERAEKD
jgi:hypothetical protein